MPETAERVSIRLADAYDHQKFLETVKRRVKLGQTLKVEGRKGKVVDLYEDFIEAENFEAAGVILRAASGLSYEDEAILRRLKASETSGELEK